MLSGLCKRCITGSIHHGTPKGKIIDVKGTRVYVATPDKDYPKDKGLLLLTNVFGIDLNNNCLLADAYAANGLKTYVPDYLNNDSIPVKAMDSGSFDIDKWFENHGSKQSRPGLEAGIAYAKAEGVKTLAAVGYCIGARYVFDLVFEGALKVAAVNHPSLLEDADLEKLSKLDFPMLFNTAEVDDWFPEAKRELADRLLGSKETYRRNHWPGQEHGFACRGDFSKEENKKAHDEAFRSSFEWISQHL